MYYYKKMIAFRLACVRRPKKKTRSSFANVKTRAAAASSSSYYSSEEQHQSRIARVLYNITHKNRRIREEAFAFFVVFWCTLALSVLLGLQSRRGVRCPITNYFGQ